MSPEVSTTARSFPLSLGPVAAPVVVELRQEPLIKAAVINRAVDFWLLGGLSFVAWAFSMAAYCWIDTNEGFDRQIGNWPYMFSALTLICNHPHFISSYRIAYGNGLGTIRRHWLTLVLIPGFMIVTYAFAFSMASKNLQSSEWLTSLDSKWPDIPILHTFVHTPDLATDILHLGVWLMWGLVGWHYAKQVYGVMLRYCAFDRYSLTKGQKLILKCALLGVIPANFVGMVSQANGNAGLFQDLPMPPFELPEGSILVTYVLCGTLLVLFIGCLVWNYVTSKKAPSINFLTPMIAFFIWWTPGVWPARYILMVPFFHCLQYLPFAYTRIAGDLEGRRRGSFSTIMTINIALILGVGFLCFDLLPTWLDHAADTRAEFGVSFFLIATVVFLNVHHFFIDSVIWRKKYQ